MSTNMTLITSVTVGSGGAASVTLPATGTIPQTYTDLMLVMSARTDRANIADGYLIKPNNTSPTVTYMTGDGSTAYSGTNYSGIFPAANATASTFGNTVAYFPNYANTSNNKSFSVDDVSENNATGAYATLSANLYSSTSAITTIVVQSINSANIVEGSTFYLYGISNVTSTTKATGGIVSSDGTYNYHMFPYSGTFTPTQAISADILVVAGGGGGTNGYYAGGGGAGGLLGFNSQSLTTTAYTVTVGAGGAAFSPDTSEGKGSDGSDSQFGSLTLVKGGGAAGNYLSAPGNNGGSGGGGGGNASNQSGGTATSGQGNNGGSGNPTSSNGAGGGGGGAGAVGGNASANIGGNGGIGSSTYSSWGLATQTGQLVSGTYYYAGGGGGQAGVGGGISAGTGGAGGGGNGGFQDPSSTPSNYTDGTAGAVNTGGGAGGSRLRSKSGGSGLVIIRYAI